MYTFFQWLKKNMQSKNLFYFPFLEINWIFIIFRSSKAHRQHGQGQILRFWIFRLLHLDFPLNWCKSINKIVLQTEREHRNEGGRLGRHFSGWGVIWHDISTSWGTRPARPGCCLLPRSKTPALSLIKQLWFDVNSQNNLKSTTSSYPPLKCLYLQ